MSQRSDERVTLRTLRRMKAAGEPFACLTSYDATTAAWLDRAGVPVLLVGDTAAEVVLGYDRTIDMPLDASVMLTAAVRRGAANALVMGDMPFLSYGVDESDSIRNAGRLMTEGRADVVKIEADASHAGLVGQMSRAGIAVCAHVGSRPQTAALSGGYGSAGRTAAEAARIIEDARALEDAGAVLLLIEAVPEAVTERVMAGAGVPVIGIGAGTACDGQILVLHDLIGLTDAPPRFAARSADLGSALTAAGRDWVERVGRREIGGRGYEMAEGESERFAEYLGSGPRLADQEPGAGRPSLQG
ncbi:MAG: 3-methyl-2-oxobutanoate hydroxymethyltransferase [Planctomycetota bacterium]